MSNMIAEQSQRFEALREEVGKVVIGQQNAISFMLVGILCRGHVLLEGVPGVAKTTMIKALTKSLGLSFKRIQFTPDLLPSDLIGTLIYNPRTQEFETKKGPIFANLILADEINRAPAKVQSALLEAMQEGQVTIGSNTHLLDKPFIVFATQNPIEQEGTYTLPEAQIDRFMFKVNVGYPTLAEEKKIIKGQHDVNVINAVMSKEELEDAQLTVQKIYCDDKIIDYITHIVFATRSPHMFRLDDIKKYITYGVSPRASIALYEASKAWAFIMHQRNFVTPDDVKAVAMPTLSHRIGLSYEAEAEGISRETLIRKIISSIPTP